MISDKKLSEVKLRRKYKKSFTLRTTPAHRPNNVTPFKRLGILSVLKFSISTRDIRLKLVAKKTDVYIKNLESSQSVKSFPLLNSSARNLELTTIPLKLETQKLWQSDSS